MKFGSSKKIAIKVVDRAEMVFSIYSCDKPHPRFLFRLIFLMSHTNDVIYKRFKERAQKQFSVEILRHHQDYYFFEVGLSFACNYWGAHVFRFYRKLSADQEIVHMIKSAVRGNLNTQKWKIYFFSLQIFFNVLHRRVRFCFFRFPVTWPQNRPAN